MIRLITLSDGTGMGDELIIFRTNAPVEELKKLENVYCKAMEFNFYINESEFEQYKSYLYSGSMQSMSQTAYRKINYEYINKNTVPVCRQ